MAMILNGKELGQRIRDKIATRVSALSGTPGLGVILVGDDPASHLYVELKRRACEEAGIAFELFLYPSDTQEDVLVQKVIDLNARADIHGILVQLPLPSQNADRIIATIDPLKDVDGFHPENLQKLREDKPCMASAVALGVMKLIDEGLQNLPDAGRDAVIVASALFAEPISILMKERGLTPTVVQAEHPDLGSVTRAADVLVVAEGIPGLIQPEMVKPGAIVVDVGTTRTDNGLQGDVAPAVDAVAGALTPVPGGVGPMTVAMLLVNILKAYGFQRT